MKFTLRQLRVLSGYTIKEMDELLNLGTGTYGTWERDPSRIKILNAIKLSTFFKVPITDINFSETSKSQKEASYK